MKICQVHVILRNRREIAGITIAVFDRPVVPANHAVRQAGNTSPMTRRLSSLRFRLIALILLAVIPAFGVILYSAAKHRNLTTQQVQRNALGAARAIAAEQERFFEKDR